MKTSPPADPDVPTQESIRELLAQGLSCLEVPEEVDYISSYLVTGTFPPVPSCISPLCRDCRALMLWDMLLSRSPGSFNIQCAVTSRYYELKRHVDEIS